MTRYVVRSGDCLSSIAERHGHFWETLWNHPDNAALRDLREDPNVLLPGDVVAVPEIVPKEETRASDAWHRFRHKGVPALCRIRLLKDGQPRANVDYTLVVDGRSTSGTTDPDGVIEAPIPPTARRGEVRVRDGRHEEVYPLSFGGLDPIGTKSGVLQRLAQLGFRIEKDQAGPIRAFQSAHGLNATGLADQATLDRLVQEYGQ